MTRRKRAQFDEREPAMAIEQEDQHKDFLLQALRAASLRAKLMDADITTIGTALKGGMIGTDTAVAWVRDAGLLWIIGAIPEEVGRVANTGAPPISREQISETGVRIENEIGTEDER